jgi:hypothetical protein
MSQDLTRPVSSIVKRFPKKSPEGVAKYLKDREIESNLENWKRVKAWVDSNEELDVSLAKEVEPRISGKHGREEHSLDLYVYTFPPKYPFISASYSWSRCKKCNETRWIKKEAWFEGNPALCYDRYTKQSAQKSD